MRGMHVSTYQTKRLVFQQEIDASKALRFHFSLKVDFLSFKRHFSLCFLCTIYYHIVEATQELYFPL